MKTLLTFAILVFSVFSSMGQTPQHVTTSSDDAGSLWESTTGIIIFVGFIVLLIGGRTLSKRIHKRRDELTKKGGEE
jgi:hypothetical protein